MLRTLQHTPATRWLAAVSALALVWGLALALLRKIRGGAAAQRSERVTITP